MRLTMKVKIYGQNKGRPETRVLLEFKNTLEDFYNIIYHSFAFKLLSTVVEEYSLDEAKFSGSAYTNDIVNSESTAQKIAIEIVRRLKPGEIFDDGVIEYFYLPDDD